MFTHIVLILNERVLKMELPGKRKRGRPNRRFMYVVEEDKQVVGMADKDTEDRKR